MFLKANHVLIGRGDAGTRSVRFSLCHGSHIISLVLSPKAPAEFPRFSCPWAKNWSGDTELEIERTY